MKFRFNYKLWPFHAKQEEMKEIKIFITDDHSLFRQGVIKSLIGKPGINFIGEADNGRELLDKLEYLKPDLVIMGLMMPVMNGLEALPILRKNYPDLKVIILSMYNDPAVICKALELGANTYLTKESSPEEIYQAILACQQQWFYINDTVQRAIAMRKPVSKGYSEKEIAILKLLAENKNISNWEIAKKLKMSSVGVESHISKLKEKSNAVSKELMLVVEVDGSIHLLQEVAKNDAKRQKALEEAGFTVLRFTNEEVLENINTVYSYLEDWIEKKLASKI